MRRDDFLETLSNFSMLTMLGVKALVVIIFVFTVLTAGLKNLQISTAYNFDPNSPASSVPVTQPLSQPLPDLAFGLTEMVIPAATPTNTPFIPTFTDVPTMVFTDTSVPTTAPSATFTPTQTATVTETTQATLTATSLVTATLRSTATALPSLTPTPKPTTSAVSGDFQSLIPSPLEGISVSELSDIITQPFIMPPTGEDSGHHGVDFAFWRYGDFTTIEGVPILSVFPGKVVSAYNKILPPYGYMVMVETPLSNLPQEVIDAIELPEASTTPANPSNRLTCPTGFADWWDYNSQSLYVLYGHLEEAPPVQLGQSVKIGDVLGKVGNSGSSTNPHLHLEMRIGPSDATFVSMGHYDVNTTDQERHNYCMWRISGDFQLFDPMVLYTDTTN